VGMKGKIVQVSDELGQVLFWQLGTGTHVIFRGKKDKEDFYLFMQKFGNRVGFRLHNILNIKQVI